MINHILLAFVATFIITVVLGKIAIPMLRSLHAQQSIREEGPESHQAKAGRLAGLDDFCRERLTSGYRYYIMIKK